MAAGVAKPANTRFLLGCFPGGVKAAKGGAEWALFEAASYRLAETFHIAYSADPSVLAAHGCGEAQAQLTVVTGKDFLTPGEDVVDAIDLSGYVEAHPHAAFDPAGVGDGTISTVSGAAVNAAVEFVEQHAVPLVGILTETNAGSLYGREKRRPLLIVFLSAIQYSNAFERSLLQKTLRNVGKVAKKHKGKLSFALADQRLEPLEPMIRSLGLSEIDEAGVALISTDALKYRMNPAEGAIGGCVFN